MDLCENLRVVESSVYLFTSALLRFNRPAPEARGRRKRPGGLLAGLIVYQQVIKRAMLKKKTQPQPCYPKV
jgi:hypothetical protein